MDNNLLLQVDRKKKDEGLLYMTDTDTWLLSHDYIITTSDLVDFAITEAKICTDHIVFGEVDALLDDFVGVNKAVKD